MNDMQYYTERLQCSDEDKKSCFGTVQLLYDYARKARKEGLLSLEDMALRQDNAFLKEGILLIVDAMAPEQVRGNLEKGLVAGDYWGRDFLEKVMIIEGVLLIQNGVNPKSLLFALSMWFGMEFRPIFEREFKECQRKIEIGAGLERYCTRVEKEVSIYPDFDMVKRLDRRSRERLLREIDDITLSIALQYTDKETIQAIFDCMSKRRMAGVIQLLQHETTLQYSAVESAQINMTSTLYQLERRGELIIPNRNGDADMSEGTSVGYSISEQTDNSITTTKTPPKED